VDVVDLLPNLRMLRFPVGQAYLWRDPDSLTLIDTGLAGSGPNITRAIIGFGLTPTDLDQATVDVCWRLVRQTGVGLLRLPSTKSGKSGERLIPLPSWAVTMLKTATPCPRLGGPAVFPDSLGGWRDPSNVRRVWRQVRDEAQMDGLVSHMLRKTVASFLDDADVPTRKISDQLGHSKVSMAQDRYLGGKLTDRQTADVLEKLLESGDS
jgi:integrase